VPEEPRWYTVATTEVVTRLSTSVDQGLSTDEANQPFGPIRCEPMADASAAVPARTIAGHLTSMPVVLLGGAAALSIASGGHARCRDHPERGSPPTLAVGYVTERRVERILTSLQRTAVGRRRRPGATAARS
jgi:hypothetical protein